ATHLGMVPRAAPCGQWWSPLNRSPLSLGLVQPGLFEADLEAALERVTLDVLACGLDERQRAGAHLRHIADDVALHLLAEVGELLGCGGRLDRETGEDDFWGDPSSGEGV